MASFNDLKYTNNGLDLQYKGQEGKELKFTRIGLGDGTYTGSIRDLTNLRHEILSCAIVKKQHTNGKVTIGFVLDNQEIEEGFYWREIGIFAEDPDTHQEKLFMYSNAGDTPDYIPPFGTNTLEKRVDIDMVISDVANITAIIDSSMIYVSKADYDEKIEEIEETIEELEENVNNLNTDIADKANKKKVYDLIIDTQNWTGTEAPYTKTVQVEGILNTDIVNMYPIWSNILATRNTEKEEYSKISMIEVINNNEIKIICDEEIPTTDLNVRLEVVY